MESLLPVPVINDLQNVFKKTGTDKILLPQIVVVGAQSCGKSSVLESLVGKSFLPRGIGIVTRSPIILQLCHVPKSLNDEPEEWCSFPSQQPDKKYTDFDEVRKEIKKQTDKLAGCKKGISVEAILVRVCSHNVIPLTVVDLPGLVKNPVDGQPYDIEEQVRKLILEYINNPNAIILAVSPANADIATSESIKIAREVDPNGDRTLAVFTKLDLMDKGTNGSKVLAGKVIYVKHGIIGVVNRSQFDIEQDKSLEDAWNDEEAFFSKTYPEQIGQIGSKYLAKRLNQLLMNHIQGALPDLIKRITQLTEEYEARQQELGPEVATGEIEKLWLMMDVVNEFLLCYKKAVKEHSSVSSVNDAERFVVDIADIFGEFTENVKKNSPSGILTESEINDAIRKSVNVEGFTNIEEVFKELTKKKIYLMETPSIQCAEAIHEVLSRAVEFCLKDKRLETLNSEICRITRRLLNDQLKIAKKTIKEYMMIQTGMIFSCDNDFLKLLKISGPEVSDEAEGEDDDSSDVLDAVKHLDRISSSSKSVRASFPMSTLFIADDNSQCQYVKSLILTYYKVIGKQIADYMPKHLMYHLYYCTIEKLREAIRDDTTGKENELISEPEHIVLKRLETKKMLQNIYQATDIIGRIKSTI